MTSTGASSPVQMVKLMAPCCTIMPTPLSVFDLDPHERIDEIMKARAVGRIEQQAERVQMVVHVIHQLHRAAVDVFRHVRGLIHVAEGLLIFEEALGHFA